VISVTTLDPSFTESKVTLGSRYTSFTGTDASRLAWNSSAFREHSTDRFAGFQRGRVSTARPIPTSGISSARRTTRGLIEQGHNYAFRAKVLWAPLDAVKVRLNGLQVLRKRAGAPVSRSTTAPSILAVGVQPQGPPTTAPSTKCRSRRTAGTNYFRQHRLGQPSSESCNSSAPTRRSKPSAISTFDASPEPIAYFEETTGGHKGPAFNNSKSVEFPVPVQRQARPTG